jgi:uncharacterized protein
MEMKFITGEAALLIGKALVVADLHLGAEHDLRMSGVNMPSGAPNIEKRLENLIKKNKANRLIILGDIKHKVPGVSFQEEREVPGMVSRLSELASVELLPGNHDGGIEKLCPGLKAHPSEGLKIGNFFLSHGHAWPGDDALKCDAIIIGHNHPQVVFSDRIGKTWRERVWVTAEFKREFLKEHYNSIKKEMNIPELILIPAFNTLVGGWAVNKQSDTGRYVGGLGPLTKCADIGNASLFLLDGTFLGQVSNI